jgi:hypothetical protein
VSCGTENAKKGKGKRGGNTIARMACIAHVVAVDATGQLPLQEWLRLWQPRPSGHSAGKLQRPVSGCHHQHSLCGADISPSSPDTPAIKQRKGQAEPEQTLNNPSGYVFPYGGLQFVAAPIDEPQQPAAQRGRVGDGLADIVSDAVSGAGFIKACWAILKARFGVAGEATACNKWSWWPTGCACHADFIAFWRLVSGLEKCLGMVPRPSLWSSFIQCLANVQLLGC